MNYKLQIIDMLKGGELLSAREIEIRLGIDPLPNQKTVRNTIDALRRNEPIWHDVKRNAFWWSDDQAIRPLGTKNRWKRLYKD